MEPQGEVQPLDNVEVLGGEQIDDAICERRTPDISANILEFNTNADKSLSYSLTIKDNNSNCDATDYSLATSGLNSEMTLTLPNTLRLQSGETQVITVNLTTSNSIAAAGYNFLTTLKDLASELESSISQKVNITTIVPDCVRTNPEITLAPASFSGYVGTKFNYDLTITNNNQYCPSASYNISYVGLPVGFVSNPPASQTIASGASKTMAIEITAGMTAGELNTNIKAQDNANATYSVAKMLSFSLSLTPPPFTITSVVSENIMENSARIKGVLSSGGVTQVKFGTRVNLGNATSESTNFSQTNHIHNLTNLVANTTYYYQLTARNDVGTEVSSNVFTFKTKMAAPTCMRANPTLTLSAASFNEYTGASVTYDVTLKNNNQYCPDTNYNLAYVNLPSGFSSNLPASKILADGMTTTFSVFMTAGTNAGAFTTSLKATDNLTSNYSATQNLSFVLTTPSQFEFVSVGSENITESSANIRFVLSENGTGKIEFGTSTNLGSFSNEETSFDYSTHVQSLRNLLPGTKYHYKVYSTNESGTSITSNTYSFTTTNAAPTCMRANPTLVITANDFSGDAEDMFTYDVTLTNNNQYCANASFNLSYLNLPTGFTSNLPASKTLANGTSTTFAVNMNSGAAGDYIINMRAMDNANNAYQATAPISFSLEGIVTPPSGDPVYPPSLLLSQISYPNYQAPTGPLPGYLQPFTDAITGNTVQRVSDYVAFGTHDYRIRHRYAKNQVWNADGTYIRLSGSGIPLLNGNTYQIEKWISGAPSMGSWSSIDPKKMYSYTGNRFTSYNIDTETTTTLRTFSEYASISIGDAEGNLSNDDRYVGLIGKNGCNRTLFVYDILNDQVLGTKDIGCSGSLDWFSVSQLGGFAAALWHDDGSGATQGLKSYSINMTNENHISDVTEHGEIGVDQQGNEVLIQYGGQAQWNQGYSLMMVRLDGGGTTPLMPYVDGQGIWGGHISTRNIHRPGWAYVTEQCCSTGSRNSASEVFAIKLDGSGTIQRFAKHHNQPGAGDGSSNSAGNHSAQGVPNQDGTKVLFASNWRHSDLLNEYAPPVWVVEVPQN